MRPQTAIGPPASALDRWIEFTNNTRMAIAEIYISPVGAQVWNVDLLGPDLLAPASSVSVNNRRWSGLSIRPQNRLRRWHHADPPKRECMRRGEICDLLSIAQRANVAVAPQGTAALARSICRRPGDAGARPQRNQGSARYPGASWLRSLTPLQGVVRAE